MRAEIGARAHNRVGTDLRYFHTFFGPQLRPNGLMPIEAHSECGRILHLVARATEGRSGAHNVIRNVSLTLDEWIMREYDQNQLDGETLDGIYCAGPSVECYHQAGTNELIEMLEAVKTILRGHYPRGAALEKLCRELDRAIISISKWDGKPRGKVRREPKLRREIMLRRQP